MVRPQQVGVEASSVVQRNAELSQTCQVSDAASCTRRKSGGRKPADSRRITAFSIATCGSIHSTKRRTRVVGRKAAFPRAKTKTDVLPKRMPTLGNPVGKRVENRCPHHLQAMEAAGKIALLVVDQWRDSGLVGELSVVERLTGAVP